MSKTTKIKKEPKIDSTQTKLLRYLPPTDDVKDSNKDEGSDSDVEVVEPVVKKQKVVRRRGPRPKGENNPCVTFLNALSLAELNILWASVTQRAFPWNRYEANRAHYDSLVGMHAVEEGTQRIIQTRPGTWWMDWVECCLFVPGATSGIRPANVKPPKNHQQLQIRNRPAGVRAEVFDAWEAEYTQNDYDYQPNQPPIKKLLAHHIAWRQQNFPAQLKQDVGRGSSVSHYCDIRGCVRRCHLEYADRHQSNMDRQRCTGVTLIVRNGQIVDEIKCVHDTTNDFTRSCRKLRVLDRPSGSHVKVDPGLHPQRIEPQPVRPPIKP
jgi:hypothetical protein